MHLTAHGCAAALASATLAVAGCGNAVDESTNVPKPGGQRTVQVTYSPFVADGAVRPDLTVIGSDQSAQCSSGSYLVVQAYRCFVGNEIHDVCYLDRRDPSLPAMVCVDAPWATRALRAAYGQDPDHSSGAKPSDPPWALELTRRGRRCTFTPGATTVVDGHRLNYSCAANPPLESELYLFGDPDRSRPMWRIRASTSPNARDLQWVQIRRAWR